MDKNMMKALEDHGPTFLCETCESRDFCKEHGKCWKDWAKNRHFEYFPSPNDGPI